MRVLVTGASGFVGGALVRRLASERGLTPRAAVRSPHPSRVEPVEVATVGSLDAATDWRAALDGVDVVVHAAARVHVMDDRAADPLAEYRRVNVAGTLNLAAQASEAGVRRLVFLSSIKVNGEETTVDRPFHPDDPPAPVDAYGLTKLEAERGLRELARRTGLEVVVIRPVLVYGPGVKANFHALLALLQRGVPLPLGGLHNRRSFVALDNLVDLVVRCLAHPAAANGPLLVSDGEDLSTPELLRRAAAALGVRARLVSVPASLLLATARLVGKGEAARRVCGSLRVDISRTRALLDWTPPVTVDAALAATAAHFLRGGDA